jgi:hypothetical protein
MRFAVAATWVLLTVVGSAGCVQRPPETPFLGCVRRVAEHRTITRDHDIIRDPRLRTWVHVDEVRTLIQRYVERHGTAPHELSQLTSLGPNLPSMWDGWGYTISYSRRGEDRFELRSPGPDGCYCTEDDFIATHDSMPPYPST